MHDLQKIAFMCEERGLKAIRVSLPQNWDMVYVLIKNRI